MTDHAAPTLREQVEDSLGHDIEQLARDAERVEHCIWPTIVLRILALIDAHDDRIERLEAALAKVDRMKVGHHHQPDALCIPECPRWWKDAIRAILAEPSDD